MARKEHVAYVPYAELIRAFQGNGGWTCAVCGGRVVFLAFGHEPRPRVPLFACTACGRQSDGCQTFEGHHLLYGYCPLAENVSSRCGYWLGEWARPRGACPVCGRGLGALLGGPEIREARGQTAPRA
jgi:putative intracellular protease/amidase